MDRESGVPMLESIFPDATVVETCVEDDTNGSDLDVFDRDGLTLARVDCKLEQGWSWEVVKRLTRGAPGVPVEVQSSRWWGTKGWTRRLPQKVTTHLLYGFGTDGHGILVRADDLYNAWSENDGRWSSAAARGEFREFKSGALGYYVPIKVLVELGIVCAIVKRHECIWADYEMIHRPQQFVE